MRIAYSLESLRYILSLIFLISAIWAMSRWWKDKSSAKFFRFGLIFIVTLLALEVAMLLYFKIQFGYWIFQSQKNPNTELFKRHPYYLVENKSHVDVTLNGVNIQHNEVGLRGRSYKDTALGAKVRIAAIGGSTTYGVGVNNAETWPHILDSITGEDTVIFNLGVPGHSTVEHLITASLQLDEVDPDVILLHVGLNDLRVSNVYGLKADYSNFHAPSIVGTMGLCYLEPLPHVASIYYMVQILQAINWYPTCEFHRSILSNTGTEQLDPYALSLYSKHLKKLIHLCQFHTEKVILIPQVLIDEQVGNGSLRWWIPFVENNHLVQLMDTYNVQTSKVGAEMNAVYVDEVLEQNWSAAEFADPSHLNYQGNLRFAEIVRSRLVMKQDSINTNPF